MTSYYRSRRKNRKSKMPKHVARPIRNQRPKERPKHVAKGKQKQKQKHQLKSRLRMKSPMATKSRRMKRRALRHPKSGFFTLMMKLKQRPGSHRGLLRMFLSSTCPRVGAARCDVSGSRIQRNLALLQVPKVWRQRGGPGGNKLLQRPKPAQRRRVLLRRLHPHPSRRRSNDVERRSKL